MKYSDIALTAIIFLLGVIVGMLSDIRQRVAPSPEEANVAIVRGLEELTR